LTDQRLLSRLSDILDAIQHVNRLLLGKSLDDLTGDRILKAAYERFLEIVSEASRCIPLDQKAKHPEISWRRIADLGNHLRHAYQHIDPAIIWTLYVEQDIDRLRIAVQKILDEIQLLS
jgi:uncharacterized protein with HEPN domain